MDTDQNLLFGVLALQADLIDAAQFAEACTAWSARKPTPLAELLVERGWLTPADRADIERLLQRKLRKHGGDAHASLAAVADDVRRALAVLNDPELDRSLAGLQHTDGPILLSTVVPAAGARERYTLTRLHATGGIGRVWLARDTALGRTIALKELRPERAGDPGLWDRFLVEAQVTGQLEHPGIVPVYELARRSDDRQPFYTMRFVQGRTLTEAARAYHARLAAGQAEPLELRTLLHAFVGVCDAVAYAHSRGVIHRDLKGQNVVLGDFGEVLVLDWGLAKVVGHPGDSDAPPVTPEMSHAPEATHHGQVVGTPAYMAPEQADGRLDLIDCRTDVYGLGAVLYEVLTGRPPFTGGDTQEVLRKVREAGPESPRQVCPAVAPALEAVCLKALAKQPAGRYTSARELAGDVQRWLADEPVAAYREPPAARLGRWARRHRPAVAAAAALLVAAVVALGAGTALLSHQKRLVEVERDRADANYRLARAAVENYFLKVSESDELKGHGLERLRKDLLESARGFMEQFLQERRDDPERRADLARVCCGLASITDAVAGRNLALALLGQARDLFDQLVRDHPANARYRRGLATAWLDLGTLYAHDHQTEPAREAFRQARALFEQLSQEERPTSRDRLALGRAHYRLGDLSRLTGQTGPAEAAFGRAVRALDSLVRDDPAARHQYELALAHLGLAQFHSQTQRGPQALATYQQAQVILTGLVRENPRQPQYRRDLASTWVGIGVVYQWQNNLDAAEKAYREADALLAPLAHEHPSVTEYQRCLAVNHANLSTVYARTNRPDDALAACQQALPLLQQLTEVHPNTPEYRFQLAGCYHQRGSLRRAQQEFAGAEEDIQTAVGMLEALTKSHPQVHEFRHSLVAGLMDLAALRLQAGWREQAAEGFRKALTELDHLTAALPERRDFVDMRGQACNALVEVLVGLGRPVEAARVCSRAAAAGGAHGDRHAGRAVALLREAAARGFRDVEVLRAEADFAALRPRDDFKKLLDELTGK